MKTHQFIFRYYKVLLLGICISCSSGDDGSNVNANNSDELQGNVTCVETSKKASEATIAFNALDKTDIVKVKEDCEALVKLVQSQIKACGDTNGVLAQKIKDLNCSEIKAAFNCEENSKLINGAKVTFENVLTERDNPEEKTKNCKALQEKLQLQIDKCTENSEDFKDLIKAIGNCDIPYVEDAPVGFVKFNFEFRPADAKEGETIAIAKTLFIVSSPGKELYEAKDNNGYRIAFKHEKIPVETIG